MTIWGNFELTNTMAIYAAPTLGRLGIITKDSCFNQAMCGFVVKSDILSSEFLFLKLYEYRDYFNTLAQGAAQQNINVEKVRMTKVLVPSFDVMCCFTTYVKPIFEQIRVLELKNLILRRTRDLLLPKLISGELDVEDLDIAVGGD
ncbi:restriction endonuclease subunit S [Moorella sp. Hama-1]|uniref:restriction endonuclease subunit S n=1 Tax=Moorella sp. Hama-1 TaxID=2138101 RepID=UPI000D644B71|nr:restriction endonuclease subunit S [Moorella sp. Hama-1]BCV20624.1 hypothetical protein hamaS1_06930 [Moorella sp. Hama-1]